jgi:NAD(P)-dependent dehydrogenase (short-subunit alcohol dehydrogenase family)
MEITAGMSAVVTGGASGMGRSISLALAGRGVHVAVVDIDENAARSTAAEVAATGVRSLARAVDVASCEQVESMAAEVWSEFGGIDIVANNAGVTLRPFRASWHTSIEDFRWVMGVNWWGVVHGHHAFVPRMLERGRPGHIVNTSSMASLVTIAGHSAYSASKAAVDAFTLCARAELAREGIGVSLLHPARVRTRIGTSERLRPEPERSDGRGIKPWVDALHPPERSAVVAIGLRDDESLPGIASEPMEMISPAMVGEMVVRGIELDTPHILTHPAPFGELAERMRQLIEGAGLMDA